MFLQSRAEDVPVSFRSFTLVARIQAGCHPVTFEILDDLCCLPPVSATHGRDYRMTELGELHGLWDSHWRLSFKITWSLWSYSRYKSPCQQKHTHCSWINLGSDFWYHWRKKLHPQVLHHTWMDQALRKFSLREHQQYVHQCYSKTELPGHL